MESTYKDLQDEIISGIQVPLYVCTAETALTETVHGEFRVAFLETHIFAL